MGEGRSNLGRLKVSGRSRLRRFKELVGGQDNHATGTGRQSKPLGEQTPKTAPNERNRVRDDNLNN